MKYLIFTLIMTIFIGCNLLGNEKIEETRYFQLDNSNINPQNYDEILIYGVNKKSIDTVTIYSWKTGQELKTKIEIPKSSRLDDVFDLILIGKKDNKIRLGKSMELDKNDPNRQVSGKSILKEYIASNNIDSTKIDTVKTNPVDTTKVIIPLDTTKTPTDTTKPVDTTKIVSKNDTLFIDSRDNKKYKITKIGNQTWFAQILIMIH